MNDDLISRQAAKDAINEHLELVTSGLGNNSEAKKIYIMAYNHVIDVINILPAIQPEQKTGRWECVDDDMNVYKCTACGEEWYLEAGTPEENNMLFCSYCGAKMTGDEINEVN